MIRWLLTLALLAGASIGGAAAATQQGGGAGRPDAGSTSLSSDLDQIFSDPLLARALIAVRVDSLGTGQVLYERNRNKLVVPASNMKIVTMAAAAERLGWNYRYETTLEAIGPVEDGVLHGDLVVTGSGDPAIGSHDARPAALFFEWVDALRAAGIRRIEGRLVGDDNAFDDDSLGAGWAWDYLADGYAAPSGALSYNENVAVVRLTPAATAGGAVRVELSPPGHGLDVTSRVATGEPKSAASVSFSRLPGDPRVTIRGSVPAGGAVAIRTTSVDNPTRFFIEGLRAAMIERGLTVTGGAWDIDDLTAPLPAGQRRAVARHESEPLATLAGNFLKVSQNFYGEQMMKTVGRTPVRTGSAEAGRQAVREILGAWGIPPDALVMYDGSGLSRYNYVTADTIVGILTHVWQSERLRGPFLAALPIGGRDGTLDTRMKTTVLEGNVQAKTGTISNVRSLSGFVETKSGEKLVFSMIANHFTAPSAQIDAIVERALVRLVDRVQ